jgi:hypothetical protein
MPCPTASADAVAAARPGPRAGRFLPSLDAWEPVATRLGLAMLALAPVLLLAMAIDPRSLQGASPWVKPLKFALAFAAYLLTLGWYAASVRPAWRARRRFRWPVAAGAAAIAMEQAIVTLQSVRGTGSHFNVATGFDAALYGAMGVGALVLTAMALPVAAGLARHAVPGRLAPGLRHAMVAGLALGCALTLVTAGTMSALGGHGVGAADGTPGAALPLLGWLRAAGDLRTPHFFATHAMHAVPLMVLALLPWRRLGPRGAWALGAAWTLFVLAVFVQALAGRPFLPL